MYCFGLISFLPDFFFPSLSGFKKGGKEGKGKRKKISLSYCNENQLGW